MRAFQRPAEFPEAQWCGPYFAAGSACAETIAFAGTFILLIPPLPFRNLFLLQQIDLTVLRASDQHPALMLASLIQNFTPSNLVSLWKHKPSRTHNPPTHPHPRPGRLISIRIHNPGLSCRHNYNHNTGQRKDRSRQGGTMNSSNSKGGLSRQGYHKTKQQLLRHFRKIRIWAT